MHFLCNSLIINRYYFCCFLWFFCCFGKKGKKSPFHEERGHSIYYIIRNACTCARVRVLLCYRRNEEEDDEHIDNRTDGL